MSTGPSCQEASAVRLAVYAVYGSQKEYVNLSLDVSGAPSDLRAVSAGVGAELHPNSTALAWPRLLCRPHLP